MKKTFIGCFAVMILILMLTSCSALQNLLPTNIKKNPNEETSSVIHVEDETTSEFHVSHLVPDFVEHETTTEEEPSAETTKEPAIEETTEPTAITEPTTIIEDQTSITPEFWGEKSVDEIVKEVILGKWGNGNERKNRLNSAGYDYRVVQAEVNRVLGYEEQSVK